MEDFTNLTQEQIFAAEAYFNLATMVGKCLEISVYQLDHPDYKPRVFVSDSVNEEAETEEEEEAAQHTGEPTPISSGRIKSNELSELAQMHQLFCLYDERIRDILGPSSLYDMFRLASSLFSYEFKSPDEEPSPLDRKKIAVAWVIVKRTFAINHMQEALHLLNLPDVLAGDIVYKTQPVGSPMDRQDELFITAACKLCEDVVFNKVPLEQVIDDALRALEKEKRASQSLILPPLGSAPNGDPLNFLLRIMSGKQEYITDNRANRHERIIKTKASKTDTVRITKINAEKGSQIAVEIRNASKHLQKANKTFIKILFFVLQKMTEQHFPLEVGFSLQELVELEMYSSTKNAWRGVQEFIKQQSDIFLTGLLKKKDNTEIEVKGNTGLLFYNVSLDNGYVRISVNDKFNFDFIASAFTVFPRFAYRLKNINAFNLVHYIFFLARQNTGRIKENGQFTIKLDAVRSRLGLPAPENVNNRRYRQLIIEPIETAIEEIEEALKTIPEAKECSFTITPVGTETTNINQWLDGYLEIRLKNDFAKKFVELATKFESTQEKISRARIKEIARLSAKKEAEKSDV